MTRTVKKPAERRFDIIGAARYLFKTKSYDQTTMQDIIDHLGIAKGTIYHYFQSKEELLEAVIDDMVSTNIASIELVLQESDGSALEKIELLAKAGNIAEDNPDLLDQLHKSANDIMHFRLLTATLVKLIPLYEKLIQQGCDEGIFKTDFPRECAEFILFAVQFLTDMGIYPWSKESLAERARAFPILIERILMAPAGSFGFMLKHMIKK